jgi:hypothetical protein
MFLERLRKTADTLSTACFHSESRTRQPEGGMLTGKMLREVLELARGCVRSHFDVFNVYLLTIDTRVKACEQ